MWWLKCGERCGPHIAEKHTPRERNQERRKRTTQGAQRTERTRRRTQRQESQPFSNDVVSWGASATTRCKFKMFPRTQLRITFRRAAAVLEDEFHLRSLRACTFCRTRTPKTSHALIARSEGGIKDDITGEPRDLERHFAATCDESREQESVKVLLLLGYARG